MFDESLTQPMNTQETKNRQQKTALVPKISSDTQTLTDTIWTNLINEFKMDLCKHLFNDFT